MFGRRGGAIATLLPVIPTHLSRRRCGSARATEVGTAAAVSPVGRLSPWAPGRRASPAPRCCGRRHCRRAAWRRRPSGRWGSPQAPSPRARRQPPAALSAAPWRPAAASAAVAARETAPRGGRPSPLVRPAPLPAPPIRRATLRRPAAAARRRRHRLRCRCRHHRRWSRLRRRYRHLHRRLHRQRHRHVRRRGRSAGGGWGCGHTAPSAPAQPAENRRQKHVCFCLF